MSISRLSIFLSKYERTEISMSEEFDLDTWREGLIKMINSCCSSGKTNVINLLDYQITHEAILLDINCLLKNGELPGLLAREEIAF